MNSLPKTDDPPLWQQNAKAALEKSHHILDTLAINPVFDAINSLDQIRVTLMSGEAKNSKIAAKLLEEVNDALIQLHQLWDISPTCRTQILKAREALAGESQKAGLNGLRKAISFSSSPPAFLRKFLASQLMRQAAEILAHFPDKASVKYLDESEIPNLFTCIEQLQEAAQLDPKNSAISRALAKAQSLIKTIGENLPAETAKALMNQLQKTGNLDNQPPELPVLSPEMLHRLSSGNPRRMALYLAGGLILIVGYVLLWTPNWLPVQPFLNLLGSQQEALAPQSAPRDSSSQSSPLSPPGTKAGTQTIDGDLVVPAPRDGISMQEAIQKIEKLGVKVPGQSGGQTANSPDDPEIPAPRDGISMQEAMQKIEKLGSKVPGQSSGQTVNSPDDQGISASRDTVSVPPAMQKTHNSGGKIPEQADVSAANTPDPSTNAATQAASVTASETDASSTSPVLPKSGRTTATKADPITETSPDQTMPQGKSQTTTTLDGIDNRANGWKPWVNGPVVVTLKNQAQENLFLVAIQNNALKVTRTPDDENPKNIPLTEVLRLDRLDDVWKLYLNRAIVVRGEQGFVKRGILTAIQDNRLILKKKVFGGYLDFEVARKNITEIALQP